ncbi:MAG: DUF3562 domain-containing protein [Steroidobacteraceae bacterium]
MASDVELIPELNGAERLSLEALAREVDVPLIEVAHLYKVERASLEDGASVAVFIPVIASRQVRIKLKRHHH